VEGSALHRKAAGMPSKNPDILFHRTFLKNKMEQRCSARIRFSASAEVIRADLVESTLVTELSLRSCYLEPITPLPRGTPVTVKIYAGNEFFQAMATVLYSRATLGVGLGFRVRVKPDLRACSAKPSRRVKMQWKKRMSKITDDYEDASAKSQVIFIE